MHTQCIVTAMPTDTFVGGCGQGLLQQHQAHRFIVIKTPSRLGTGETAGFVGQSLQSCTQALTGIHVFKHQLLVAFAQTWVYA